jgi:tetratricopeptide (TPR) repeat protein
VSFWRKEVIDPALERETAAHIREQKEWIAREPGNARPWYNLAQLYRIEQRQDEALALLLEAVRLDDTCADAHVALTEIYAVRGDYPAAARHARKADEHGNARAAEFLRRHGLAQAVPDGSQSP